MSSNRNLSKGANASQNNATDGHAKLVKVT